MLDVNIHNQTPNVTIRTLYLRKWSGLMLGPLLNLLPNLRRLKTSFSKSISEPVNFDMCHMSLEHLQISLLNPSDALEKILPYVPNLKQLRVTGMIREQSGLEFFKKLVDILCIHTPVLQKFDCELYCNGLNDHTDILIIQQLHPFFKRIQRHLGDYPYQCYATNLKEYSYSKDDYILVILTVELPYLERFFFFGDISCCGDEILHSVLDTKHFPSLKVCQFSDSIHHTQEFHKQYRLPNNTIRTLIHHISNVSTLGPLLHLLPNLRRLETSFAQCVNQSLNFDTCHISLKHLRISLVNPSNDLEKILPYMPNLKQLRVTGIIREQSILEHFKRLNNIVRIHTPILEKFDCELYCDQMNDQVNILIIQQLHPFFNMIQHHKERFLEKNCLGNHHKYCYATDLTKYSISKEYEYNQRITRITTEYYPVLSGYDSGQYCDVDDGWF
ncbi:unnamed protein product [Rotaria sp. Silwood1]|nr:unnamed protein product [Rotaria sp. Silwood1]